MKRKTSSSAGGVFIKDLTTWETLHGQDRVLLRISVSRGRRLKQNPRLQLRRILSTLPTCESEKAAAFLLVISWTSHTFDRSWFVVTTPWSWTKAKPNYSTRLHDTVVLLAFVKMSCYNCHQNGARRCKGCLHVTYCSRECQTQHWSKHRPNCISTQFSLNALFDACRMGVFPVPSTRCDYGFDNMQLFHGDVMTPEGLLAETILMGLYQVI